MTPSFPTRRSSELALIDAEISHISSDGLPNLLHRDRSDAHRLATTKLDIVQDTSGAGNPLRQDSARAMLSPLVPVEPVDMDADGRDAPGDRKSTRLNSSH